jgi:hypothetical protein
MKENSWAKTIKTIGLILLAIFIASCGSDSAPNKKLKPLSEDNKIMDGFATTAANHFGLVDFKLKLKPEAFEQNFLLNTSAISGPPSPSGSAYANKIVYFKKRGGTVGMFENQQGKLSVARSSLETEVLVAEFPILNNYQGGSVLIDFNKGMKLFYSKDGMRAGEYRESPESASAVQFSYVRDAYVKGNYFYISQVARVDNKPVEIRYALSTYVTNEKFVPKKADETNSVGYFQIPKVIEEGTGKETNYITKFDTNKKIVWHLTNSIPADYLQAVKDGVLYWNQAFEQDLIEVKVMPKNVSIHEPGYNVVQWLEWDDAGFAYANLHADPLSGETLQAFIYMTSVFPVGGINQAKRLLRKFNSDKLKAPERLQHMFIDGFSRRSEICSKKPQWALQSAMLQLSSFVNELDADETLTTQEKDELYLRFAQDYVREVVAHEIGHALGLRHNFAGSQANTIRPKFYDRLVKAYYFTGELPNGQTPNATVMDYTPGVLAAMIGSHIRNGREALPYDKAAIQWGYSSANAIDMDIPTFCTDSKASGVYADCLRFDYFADVFEGSKKEWDILIDWHGFSLNSRFNFLNEDKYKKKNHSLAKMLRDIQNVSLDPVKTANAFYGDKKKLLSLATAKSHLWEIRKKYPETMSVIETIEYQEELANYKKQKYEKLGGFSKVFFSNLELEATETEVRPFKLKVVNNIFEDFNSRFAKDFETIDPVLTEKIQARVNKYFSILEKEYLTMELSDLKELKPILKDENFSKELKAYADKILFLETNDIVAEISSEDASKEIKEFYFNYTRKVSSTKTYDLRKIVVELLKQDYYPDSPSWERTMKPLKKEIKEKHTKYLESITKVTKEEDLDPDLYDWYIKEKKRFSSL